MIAMDSVRLNMSYAEWKLMRTEVQATGLFYQCDPKGVWIQLPCVTTEGERQLHKRRINTVRMRLTTLRKSSKKFMRRIEHVS